jgi:cation:H+ antiporter
MLANTAWLLLGLLGLYFGAELLVGGSSYLARRLGIRPAIIGVTIVAYGTSLPEFVVSVVASVEGVETIALGNVIGSNIFNIAIILGISGLLYSLEIDRQTFRREFSMMVAGTLFFVALSLDGRIGRLDGLLLLACIAGLTAYSILTVRAARNGNGENERAPTPLKTWFLKILAVVAGIVALSLGAKWMVDAAVFFARYFGVEERIIGLTVVAQGTSLPELAASLVSGFRKEPGICFGNVIGSNIFNLLLVVGFAALIRPIPSSPMQLKVDLIFLVGYTLVLVPLLWTRTSLGRRQALPLLLGYPVFLFFLLR